MAEPDTPLHERRERGVALLVAIMAVALLTIAVMQFTFASQVDYRRTAHWVKAREARLLADSGLSLGSEFLASAAVPYFWEHRAFKEADGLTEVWGQLCPEPSPSLCPAKAFELPGCSLQVADSGGDSGVADEVFLALHIDDEAGLFNLNRLSGPLETEYGRFRKLLAVIGLRPEIAEPIAAWTRQASRNITFTHDGRPPRFGQDILQYPGRGGQMKTFRELALIEGVTSDDLVALRRVAAVLPADVGDVNINTAPFPVLRATHDQLDDELLLARLHQARCTKPITSDAELSLALGLSLDELEFEQLVTYRSEHFRVRATGAVGDVYQSVEALVHRPYPPDYQSSNSTAWDIELTYYLARRGPNIPGIDASGTTSLEQLSRSLRSGGGLL